MAHDTACDDGSITDNGTWLGFYRCNSCTSVYYSRELIIEVLEIFLSYWKIISLTPILVVWIFKKSMRVILCKDQLSPVIF